MIKNFEEIKSQLKDLSEIINGFKSEAVQLRIVDLVFGIEAEEDEEIPAAVKESTAKKKSAKKRTAKIKLSEETSTKSIANKKSGTKPAGQGAVSMLAKLVDEDFFKTPKSIGDITQHCDHNLARKFNSNEFSGKLGRLVREGKLKRTKNADNQYEYQNG